MKKPDLPKPPELRTIKQPRSVIVIIIVSSVVLIFMFISIIRTGCGTIPKPPPLQLKFSVTDSGLFVNEYRNGRFNRTFGPVPEYK